MSDKAANDNWATQFPGHKQDGDSEVLLDALASGLEGVVSGLKLAKDGRTVLIPQPTDDANDPINWSWAKKHTMLLIVSLGAFLGDFISAAGVPCLELQGIEWDRPPTVVTYATNLNILMVGLTSILWIALSYIFGRAPVLFWTALATTFLTLGCTLSTDFAAYYGLRGVQGIFLPACQVIGLSYIHDMFFFHEHARKIGIWASCIIVSPYISPMLGFFIIGGTGQWRPVYWLCFALCCAELVLVVVFADESFYDRGIPPDQQPSRGPSRLLRMLGVWQVRNRSYSWPVGRACGRIWKTFLQPTMIPIMLSYSLTFMWAVGINISAGIFLETPVSAGGYGYSATSTGYIYFAPLLGLILGESFGHFFNDYLAARYARRHKGRFVPEARLWTNYLAAAITIAGLVLVGQTLGRHLSIVGMVFGWGLSTLGLLMFSVAITAYALDSYPIASGEVGGLLNLARELSGFTVGYFQVAWGRAQGYGATFGIQAAVVAVAAGLLVLLHVYGKRWRGMAPKALVF